MRDENVDKRGRERGISHLKTQTGECIEPNHDLAPDVSCVMHHNESIFRI